MPVFFHRRCESHAVIRGSVIDAATQSSTDLFELRRASISFFEQLSKDSAHSLHPAPFALLHAIEHAISTARPVISLSRWEGWGKAKMRRHDARCSEFQVHPTAVERSRDSGLIFQSCRENQAQSPLCSACASTKTVEQSAKMPAARANAPQFHFSHESDIYGMAL